MNAKSHRLEVARERSRSDLPSASNSSVDSGHRVGEEPASALELKNQVEDFWTPHLHEVEEHVGESGRSSSSRLTLLEQRIGDPLSSVARLTELEKHVRDFQSSLARLTELEKHSEETQSHVEQMRKSFERDLIRVARGEMRRVNDLARCEEESIVTEVRSNCSCAVWDAALFLGVSCFRVYDHFFLCVAFFVNVILQSLFCLMVVHLGTEFGAEEGVDVKPLSSEPLSSKNPLSPKSTFIKIHYHQKPLSAKTTFIRNHFHQKSN